MSASAGYLWGMSKATIMPVALEPAPRGWLTALYGLALLPLVGVLLVVLFDQLARRVLVKQGRHMGAMHLGSHAKGALILGLVWGIAFAGRRALLDTLIALSA